MSLAEALATPPQPEPVSRPKSDAPGYYEWDGSVGVINTRTVNEQPKTWDAFLRDAGLDPAEVSVDEPVQVRGWDAPQAGGGIVRMRYYRLNVRRRRPGPSIDDLLKHVKRGKPGKLIPAGQAAFVVALGDLQLGKVDGDGVAGTVDRTIMGIDGAAALYKAQRKPLGLGPIHLAFLGDCVEGFTSQGGANAWRTRLTMTEQIRLLRRIMLHAVQTFAPLTDSLTVIAVPGNHGETIRFAGKGITRYDDSHDTESLHAVADALAQNPAAYGHVRCFTPAEDELTVTLEVAGTRVAHAHGHSWRSGQHFRWWEGQAFGGHQPGEADVLLAGHLHHLNIEQSGKRTFIQVPALESESTWFRHKTGQTGAPGVLTCRLLNGAVANITVV